jgi:hypothetical protein
MLADNRFRTGGNSRNLKRECNLLLIYRECYIDIARSQLFEELLYLNVSFFGCAMA